MRVFLPLSEKFCKMIVIYLSHEKLSEREIEREYFALPELAPFTLYSY